MTCDATADSEPTSAPGRGIVVRVPVSVGELVDKLTILEIKRARLDAECQRDNVTREWRALMREWHAIPSADRIRVATQGDDLRRVNAALWDIEDRIRTCELRGDFGAEFIALARSVYQTNDRRAALKRSINALLNSAYVEEKSYAGAVTASELTDGPSPPLAPVADVR